MNFQERISGDFCGTDYIKRKRKRSQGVFAPEESERWLQYFNFLPHQKKTPLSILLVFHLAQFE